MRVLIACCLILSGCAFQSESISLRSDIQEIREVQRKQNDRLNELSSTIEKLDNKTNTAIVNTNYAIDAINSVNTDLDKIFKHSK